MDVMLLSQTFSVRGEINLDHETVKTSTTLIFPETIRFESFFHG
jgi:hypothetical protein